MDNSSKTKNSSFIACLACLGAPDEYRTACTVCSGSGESSGQRNKEAALHEADLKNIDIEGLINAVRCMGFNPYRLSMLFSRYCYSGVQEVFSAIGIKEDALMEYFATEEKIGKYTNINHEGMENAKKYFQWAQLNFNFLFCGKDAEFEQRFARWRE